MKLTLDHTQRLNLHALLGAQRADVGAIRAIWMIQDKIALDADEEKAVELKREFTGGQERVIWSPSLSVAPKEFEFTEAEVARIKLAVEVWAGYGVSADRRWLEPLLALILPDPDRCSLKTDLLRPVSEYNQMEPDGEPHPRDP